MSSPVSFDVKMTEIAAHCLDLVAQHVGVPVGDLRPVEFQIMRFEDGSHAGRVTIAALPLAPSHFEPNEPREGAR